MTKLIFEIALLALLLGVTAAKSTLDLNSDNFAAIISDLDRPALIKFYRKGCGHCDRMAPEFEAAARDIESRNLQVTVAEVNCTAEPEINKRQRINLYPMVHWFDGSGALTEIYARDRTAGAYVEFVEEKLGLRTASGEICRAPESGEDAAEKPASSRLLSGGGDKNVGADKGRSEL